MSSIQTKEMVIEGIRQFDPGLPIDSKFNGTLLDPIVSGTPAHISDLFDLDPTRGYEGRYRLETIERLELEPVRCRTHVNWCRTLENCALPWTRKTPGHPLILVLV